MNLKKLYNDIKKSKSFKETLKEKIKEVNEKLNKKIYITESDLQTISLCVENNFGLTDLFLEEIKKNLINKTFFKIKDKYILFSRLDLILEEKIKTNKSNFNKKKLIKDDEVDTIFKLDCSSVLFKITDLFEESDFFGNNILLTEEKIIKLIKSKLKEKTTEKHIEYIFQNLFNIKPILFFNDFFISKKTFEKIKELKKDFDSLSDEERNKILSIFIEGKL